MAISIKLKRKKRFCKCEIWFSSIATANLKTENFLIGSCYATEQLNQLYVEPRW